MDLTDGAPCRLLEELPADGLPRERAGARVRYNFQDLVIDPNDPTTLYAGIQDGVYRSTDRGATWSRASQGLYVEEDQRRQRREGPPGPVN